jgi:CheY-like chemotaxis protein
MHASEKDSRWVLLVDDHDDGRELLGEFLSHSGYAVEACASGEEALERVEKLGVPGAVITDLSLGHMSGAELARRLREQETTASVPILVVTGHTGVADPDHLFSAILVKPVPLAVLTATLQRAFGSSSRRP